MAARLVERPMAPRLITIKNLLNDFILKAISGEITPNVLSKLIIINPTMNQGNKDHTETFVSWVLFFIIIMEKTKTVGIIARVRVNFTMVAYSPANSENV